jgi:HEAT repeat protein/beta-lactamase regulating signal transducer with metallopeptidase domain
MLDWLLSYAAHSTLLLGAAWLLSTRTRSHLVREALWKTALFGAFCTATAQTALGVRPLSGSVVVAPTEPTTKLKDLSPAIPGLTRPDLSVPSAESASSASPNSAFPASFSLTTPDLIVLVWATLAAGLLSLYFLRRVLLARRIAHRRPVMTHPLAELLRRLSADAGIQRPIRLTTSPRLASPIALGSSEIAVPEAALTELDPEQQRGMLAHELAHLERRDPAWLVLAALAERIGFFQPLNRLARRRIQESAEYLCDEWAVRRTGSGVFLAKCLAKVAEWMDSSPSAVPVAGMAEERSHLVARVRRLLDGAPFPANPRGRTVALLATFGVLGVTLLAPGISLAGPQPDTALQAGESEPDRPLSSQDTSRAVIRALMEAGRDADVEVRRAALRSLARYEDPGTVPVFRAALRDADAEIRATAIQALAEFKDRTSVGAIAALLTDENTEIRRAAAEALGELPAAGARNELIAALKDTDAEVRAHAIEALAQLKDPSAVEALTAAMKDPKPDVRARAIEALHEMDLPNPPAGLLDALRDPSAEVRHQAVHAVGHFQDARAVPVLRTLLEDPSGEVREAAVEALSEIRNEPAIEALMAALKSKDAKVRRAAADALGQRER